jgi:hypothetical protein
LVEKGNWALSWKIGNIGTCTQIYTASGGDKPQVEFSILVMRESFVVSSR